MDRRHYLALVGSGLTLSTAGCVGGDDDGNGDNGGDDGTDDGGNGGNGGGDDGSDGGGDDGSDGGGEQNEPTGSVTENTIEELALENWHTVDQWGEGHLEVEIDVRNDGNEETELNKYRFTVIGYDENDNIITEEDKNQKSLGFVTESGEVGEVTVQQVLASSVTVDDVERYDIKMECNEESGNGVYCDG